MILSENIFNNYVGFVINISEYNLDQKKFDTSKLLIILPTEFKAPFYDKLSQETKFLNYGKYLTTKEERQFKNAMSSLFGNKWESDIGFKKNGKEIKSEKQILYFIFKPISNLTKFVDILFYIEDEFENSIMELLSLTDSKGITQMIKLAKTSEIKHDEKFNLELIVQEGEDRFNEFVLTPKEKTKFLYCRNYYNFIFDILTEPESILLNFHISKYLPLIDEYQYEYIISKKRLSSNPFLAQKQVVSKKNNEIYTNKKNIEKYIFYSDFKNFIFEFDLLENVIEIYNDLILDTNILFKTFNTDDIIQNIIIKDYKSDDFIIKFQTKTRNDFSPKYLRNILIQENEKSSLYFFPLNVSNKFKNIKITLRENSILQIQLDTTKFFRNMSEFNDIIKIIDKIVSEINKNINFVYPKFIDKITVNANNFEEHIISSNFTAIYNLIGEKKHELKFSKTLINLFPDIFYKSNETNIITFIKMHGLGDTRITIKPNSQLSIFVGKIDNFEYVKIALNIFSRFAIDYYGEISEKKIMGNTRQIIKLLKKRDPVRFDYAFDNFEQFSIISQKNKQPTIISEDDIKRLKLKPHQYVRVKNMTNPNETDIYASLNPKFPYIGFSQKIFAKENHCLPTSFKTDQRKKKNAKIAYNFCTGKSKQILREKIQSDTYILNYKNEFPPKRYIYLPDKFMKILNLKYGKNNFVNSKTNLYFIKGGKPNNLVNLIEPDFLEKTKKLLDKKPHIFELINENVGNKFITIDNYIQFLQDPKLFKKHSYIDKVIEEIYPNLLILFLIKRDGKFWIDFIGKGITIKNIMSLASEKNIMLFHKFKSNYSKIIYNSENFNVHDVFTNEDQLVDLLLNLISHGKQLKTSKKKQDLVEQFLVSINQSPNFKITRWLYSDEKYGYSILFQKKEISFITTPDIKVPSKNALTDVKVFLNFFDKSFPDKAFNLRLKFGYRNKNGIFMVFLNIPIIFPIKPCDDKTIRTFWYETSEKRENKPPKILVDFIYNEKVMKILLNDISNSFRKKRNIKKRKELLKIIKSNSLSKLDKLDWLSVKEVLFLKEISKFKKERFETYFSETSFNFDIEDIVQQMKSDPVKLISKLLQNKIKIIPKANKMDIFKGKTTEICTPKKNDAICKSNKILIEKSTYKNIFSHLMLEIKNNLFLQNLFYNFYTDLFSVPQIVGEEYIIKF